MMEMLFDRGRPKLLAVIRRIVDLTSPSLPPLYGENRSTERSTRCLPVLIVPYDQRQLQLAEATTAITKDFSGQGLSELLHQPFRGRDVVVGFWIANQHLKVTESTPAFLRGHVEQTTEIGGGFWQLGLELDAVLEDERSDVRRSLLPLAARLVPKHELRNV